MDVEPEKKYKTPSYPTLAQLKNTGAYSDCAFNGRQTILISAAAIAISTLLTGCVTQGTPSVEQSRLPGAPPTQQYSNEHDTYTALQTAARERTVQAMPTVTQPDIFHPDWNAETDIRTAFDEFLSWMKAEGIV